MRWLLVIASAALVALAGCSTGDDAVAQGGTFEFVAPGGKTDIVYDPPESRGKPGRLAGPSLMDPDKTVSLDDFAGKVVVVNVWGQWCGPCRSEIGQLQKVYDATKADGVAFLGIDVRDNNRDAARDFARQQVIDHAVPRHARHAFELGRDDLHGEVSLAARLRAGMAGMAGRVIGHHQACRFESRAQFMLYL